jgi:rare lipoprotein A (peptidoglycan hydrolase)
MKGFLLIGLLGFATILPCFAQAQAATTVEGYGSWYDDGIPGLFAAHATYPFGTQLRVTNPANQQQIVVQVGGRIPRDPRWLIDISVEGAYLLEMNEVGFTLLRIEEIPRENKPRTLRSNVSGVRKFFQTGHAELWQDPPVPTQIGHPSLPIGTRVRLSRRDGEGTFEATVGTRVRAMDTRILSLSRAAADALGLSLNRSGISMTQIILESVN